MTGNEAIFLLDTAGHLERMQQAAYSSEDVLQELLASHPDVLAGEQINPDDPPRWLLVTREVGIPDLSGSGARWSADHLLLDQWGVPTFVETKRSSDTRIRREIIGQMLEYAAHASRYWPSDRIRSLASEQAGGSEALDARVRELLRTPDAGPAAVEDYWTLVEAGLRNGPMRLLFVADELPRELRRVIEFLNEHMPNIEVLGVEVRHYAHEGLRALVPRVVGQTERTREAHATQRSTRKTTEAEFLQQCPDWSIGLFRRILGEALADQLTIGWGTKGFSVRTVRGSGESVPVLYGYPAGALGYEAPYIEIYLKYLTESEAHTLRDAVLGAGGFVQRGQYTLGLLVSPASLHHVEAALPSIWDMYRSVRAVAV